MIKPVSFTGRIESEDIGMMIQRAAARHKQEVLSFADLEMNLATFRTRRSGQTLHLTPTEFRILKCLMWDPERVFSRDELARAAWPENATVNGRTVDVHVGRLRKALGTGFEDDLIRTVRSVGYALSK
ncbi:MAG: winged helix-turn-helix domain-containing protein [Hyphomicrobiales bacterium]|nr:winged helix-turn-helix domain-containing protein [Hyphomicrobiales bacterium]